MRIDRVEIDGFGKLNNCSYDFSDGVNLIYGKNESGKSTLCEFIFAMFYGLPNESKRLGNDLASRKKYHPWNSDAFGGRVHFTDDDGKKLVIERSFRATKRSDKVTLRNADTWEEIGDADSIGEKCFGLSRDAFLKTLYIKSLGADSLRSDDGEIMSRLSNLETSGDEDVSYSKIINSMEKEIYSLKTKTGKGGKIVALDEKITALNNEKMLSAMTYTSLENDLHTAENLKDAATKKESEAKSLEEKYNRALQYEKYLSHKKLKETNEAILKRIKAEEEKLELITAQLESFDNEGDILISAEQISHARALETKKLIAEEKTAEAQKQIPPDEKPKILGDNRIIPAFFGLVILALGFFLKNNILYIAGVLVAVLGILACLLINFKKQKDYDKKKNAYYEAKAELDKIEAELMSIFEPYGVSVSDELSKMFMSSQDREERRMLLKNQYEECKENIKSLSESVPEEESEKEFLPEVLEYAGENAEMLFEKINMAKSEARQMTERANEILVRVAKETAEIRTEDEITSELEAISLEKQEAEKRYNALTKAYDWLCLSHQEIKNNFAPRLNQKASLLLSRLTGEKYTDLKSSDSFDINLKADSGEIVEAGYMSRGTYDLLYIALRFASVSVLTEGNIPPVILDDAFSQLDDARLLNAIDMIEKDTEFSQVLLFTCHENYKEIIKNAKLIEL